MMQTKARTGAWVVAVTLAAGLNAATWGQSLQQRIDDLRQRQRMQAQQSAMERVNIQARLRDLVDPVDIQDAPVRTALQWYSATTGIPVVVDWRSLENEGIDPERRISLQMRHIPAGQLLALIMRMASPDEFAATLMYETTPWYVQVMTKRQADRMLITRVYEVGDLLVDIPNFTNAPEFDLNSALSNTNSGGSTGRSGSGSSLLRDETRDPEQDLTRQERMQQLADLIRDTIEPDVWVENGGSATIRFMGTRLVVSAPRYVHAKIGVPVIALDADAYHRGESPSVLPARSGAAPPPGVAGVNPTGRSSVSGVSR